MCIFSVKSVNRVVGGCFHLSVSRSLKICDVEQVKCSDVRDRI